MQFQASGNDFAIIISFSIGIEALEGLFTWEKTKEISYDLGPGSSEGTQMNHDSDKDGLSDDYEIEIGSADTDGDGWPDGIDLDPRSSLIPNIVIVVIILAFATIIIVYYYKLKKHRKIRNKSQSVKPLK